MTDDTRTVRVLICQTYERSDVYEYHVTIPAGEEGDDLSIREIGDMALDIWSGETPPELERHRINHLTEDNFDNARWDASVRQLPWDEVWEDL